MNRHNTTKHNNVTTYSYIKISLGNDLAKQGNEVILPAYGKGVVRGSGEGQL